MLNYVSQVLKRIKLNSTIKERLTKFWETKTWKKEEMSWKLTEKLICLNRCLYWVTQNPRKNVWHLVSVFLAELASPSDDYIDSCDIHRKKHSCRCYVLPVLHKITSVPPRLFDVRDATTQSRDLKHTKCLRLGLTRLTTKWGVDHLRCGGGGVGGRREKGRDKSDY